MSAIDGKALAGKLRELNRSTMSIQQLAKWCLFWRKSAPQCVRPPPVRAAPSRPGDESPPPALRDARGGVLGGGPGAAVQPCGRSASRSTGCQACPQPPQAGGVASRRPEGAGEGPTPPTQPPVGGRRCGSSGGASASGCGPRARDSEGRGLPGRGPGPPQEPRPPLAQPRFTRADETALTTRQRPVFPPFPSPSRRRRIVGVWAREVGLADDERVIALLYLTNEILQQSKAQKKGTEFLKEFGNTLPAVSQGLQGGPPGQAQCGARGRALEGLDRSGWRSDALVPSCVRLVFPIAWNPGSRLPSPPRRSRQL